MLVSVLFQMAVGDLYGQFICHRIWTWTYAYYAGSTTGPEPGVKPTSGQTYPFVAADLHRRELLTGVRKQLFRRRFFFSGRLVETQTARHCFSRGVTDQLRCSGAAVPALGWHNGLIRFLSGTQTKCCPVCLHSLVFMNAVAFAALSALGFDTSASPLALALPECQGERPSPATALASWQGHDIRHIHGRRGLEHPRYIPSFHYAHVSPLNCRNWMSLLPFRINP
jgi:hypothetical protein